MFKIKLYVICINWDFELVDGGGGGLDIVVWI